MHVVCIPKGGTDIIYFFQLFIYSFTFILIIIPLHRRKFGHIILVFFSDKHFSDQRQTRTFILFPVATANTLRELEYAQTDGQRDRQTNRMNEHFYSLLGSVKKV